MMDGTPRVVCARVAAAMVRARVSRYNGLRRGARCYTLASPSDSYLRRGVVGTGIRTMARIEVRSEITGTVWKLMKQPGDQVEAGTR